LSSVVLTVLAFVGTPVNRGSLEDYSSSLDPSEFFPISEETQKHISSIHPLPHE